MTNILRMIFLMDTGVFKTKKSAGQHAKHMEGNVKIFMFLKT